jgi:hypothetical protein
MACHAFGSGITGSKSRSVTEPSSEVRVSRTPLATTHAALAGNDERASNLAWRTRLPFSGGCAIGASKRSDLI